MNQAVAFCRENGFADPEIAVVLGSGLGPLADRLKISAETETSKIPGWPQSTVVGHAGLLAQGTLGGRRVLMLKGRVHAYEGYELGEVALPIRVMAKLGAKLLINTNSSGGINAEFKAGDIMLITDHLNLQGQSPLHGPNIDEWGPRFPDMSEVYDRGLRDLALEIAVERKIALRTGVYVSTPGPQYETPAEIRMMRILGGDAVGMSSVPEAITARHMGMKVLGLAAITNMASGISKTNLSHQEVIEAGRKVGTEMSSFLERLIEALPGEGS